MKKSVILFSSLLLFFAVACSKKDNVNEQQKIKNIKELTDKDKEYLYFSPTFESEKQTGESEKELFKNDYSVLELNGKKYYVCEGDILIEESSIGRYLNSWKHKNSDSSLKSKINGEFDNIGNIIKWDSGYTLSYSIQKSSFDNEQEYMQVVQNMINATKDWENTCNINFKYEKANDENLNSDNLLTLVTFAVVKTKIKSDVIASAFFPNDAVYKRFLLIFPDYFSTLYNKTGVLRHEIGHIMGFRHEHIRTEAPLKCADLYGFEPKYNILKLTDYDPNSVMHYLCGNLAGNLELAITEKDKVGAQKLYGPPIK